MTSQIIPSGTSTTQVATANINSETLDLAGYKMNIGVLSFTAITTGFNSATATVKIQHSNDNSNWEDVTDGSITIASGSAAQSLTPITYAGMRYYRIVYTKNSNSAGTIQVIVNVQ